MGTERISGCRPAILPMISGLFYFKFTFLSLNLTLCIYFSDEGGTFCKSLPHNSFAIGPICKTNFPPLAISE